MFGLSLGPREDYLLRRYTAEPGTAGTGLTWEETIELHQLLTTSGEIYKMDEDYTAMAEELQKNGFITGYNPPTKPWAVMALPSIDQMGLDKKLKNDKHS
jgi:hypothetical protein